MLPLSSPRWAELSHAYGAAADIPRLLERAPFESRAGHEPASVWFDLWSALCHQGDAYTASYAAVPHLVGIAKLPSFQRSYDPILLAGCIELARLEGTGPDVPSDLTAAYFQAIEEARILAEDGLARAWDDDSREAFSGSLAALKGR
ncbi:MAG: hypothetical protein JSV41_05720 [Gemmatimonadota bacterium]|nr:MAG: hypothetical protein JSV41_05720 [Gemmatimonadota bacterium]